jgi:hypothetical protein
LTEREPFIAPGGTLFLLSDKDVLLTTLEGGEAIIPLGDLASFLRYLDSLRAGQPSEEDPPMRPPFSVIKRQE